MESFQQPPSSSSSVTSSSNSNAVIDSGERNWLDLPRDTVLSIFVKLDTIDLLVRAHNVCTTWRNISKDPFLYRTINMPNFRIFDTTSELKILCHRAIDYSCGHIIGINIENFCTDDLLLHIANSASHLRCLRLACCFKVTDGGLCVVAEKLPHLEELKISFCCLSHDSLEAIGRCFPQLKTFKFNVMADRFPDIEYDDDVAFAIAHFMPELRHLQLFENKITNDGLLAILDGCSHLESLDIRLCFNINLEGSLGKRCKEQIKYLRHPYDTMDDNPSGGISDRDLDLLSDDDYEFSDRSYEDNYYDF